MTDWLDWHRAYEDPDSYLSRRLVVVQHYVREALDRAPDGPITVLSLCAGQSLDLAGVLVDHRRRGDVRGRVIDGDPGNTELARTNLVGTGVEVVLGDASTTDLCEGSVPAHLVLACGIFGNITDGDIERVIGLLPGLCAPGATVIWTRHRHPPDLTPTIRAWFAAAGFEERGFTGPDDVSFGVGAHTLVAPPVPFPRRTRLFTFVGDGRGALT